MLQFMRFACLSVAGLVVAAAGPGAAKGRIPSSHSSGHHMPSHHSHSSKHYVQGGHLRPPIKGGGGKVAPGAGVQLNPQPLPPRQLSPGSKVQLNPQPLPPGSINPGSKVQLNPQPLPPGRLNPGSKLELNPQPLPPGSGGRLGQGVSR